MKTPGRSRLPLGWTYSLHPPEEGGATLILNGPYHLSLCYRFAPPEHGHISDTWILSLEGDKSTFHAGVAY